MNFLDKLGIGDKLNFDDLYNKFLGLERSRQIAVGVGLVILLLVVLSLPVLFVTAKLDETREDYSKYIKKASEFYGILNEYKKLNEEFNTIKTKTAQLGKDPLTAILYKAAEEVDIKKSALTVTTEKEIKNDLFTEMPKKIKINNVRFDQAVQVLDKLVRYEEMPITIKQLDIEVTPNNKLIMKTMNFTASVIRPNM
ncbi:MAG: hypothetical protein HQM16_14160 [Deltaproteobacteria bacterium]|nr:hypothetical protein [Deltaproteobacteria bacterium]